MAPGVGQSSDVGRAISAFYREVLQSSDTAGIISSSPVHDRREGREGINGRQFLHFLAHYRVLTSEFTHFDAWRVFLSRTDKDREGLLDMQGFKQALTAVASDLAATPSGRRNSFTSEVGEGMPARPVVQGKGTDQLALEDLLYDINMRREYTMNQESHALLSPMYDEKVVRATYCYDTILWGLFHHYAAGTDDSGDSSSNPSLSTTPRTGTKYRPKPQLLDCRSFCRMCRILGFMPDCVVPGEMVDLITRRCVQGRGTSQSRVTASAYERNEQTAERRYLDEGRMLFGGDLEQCLVPARGVLVGEPTYTFPDFVELMMYAAFVIPPRPVDEPVEVRAERIHEIFGGSLGFPRSETQIRRIKTHGEVAIEACGIGRFLADAANKMGLQAQVDIVQKRRYSGTSRTSRPAPVNLREILVRLSEELPALPEKPEANLPGPNPATTEDLAPQPPTIDELLMLPPGQRVENLVKSKKKGKKITKSVKVHIGIMDWEKPIFYAKRPPEKKPEIPPQCQVDWRSRGFEALERRLLQKHEATMRASAPETGCLRMSYIDEPLRAPQCPQSEQVSTLMETAIAARRLRHYGEAVALLVRARTQWSAVLAGRQLPAEWADVQPLVPTPSPWGLGQVSAAGQAARSARGNCHQSCRNAMTGPSETGSKITAGNAVFRRFQATCASSHGQRRAGATASLAAATASARGEPHPEGGVAKVNHLPSDRDGSQSARISLPPFRDVDLGMAKEEIAAESTNHLGQSEIQIDVIAPPVTSTRPSSSHSRATPSNHAHYASGVEAPEGRRYNPKNDFKLALGDDEADLERLPFEASIFFFCELASLHFALQEDDCGAQLLWRAMSPTERLPPNHPDAAAVWCGMGRLAFLAGAHEVAGRATWKARWIRERTLGADTIETATSYNNLACCLFSLSRIQEAFAFLELAEELVRVLAGEDHPRSQTILRNLHQARAAQKQLTCEVPHLFSYYVPEIRARGRPGKKKKKKGSKKGSSRGSSAGKKSKRK